MTGRPILVVAAWAPELLRLRALLRLGPPLNRPVFTEVVGVGLVEAAIGTATAIAVHRPTRVILVGTAGLFPGQKSGLELGDVFSVKAAALGSGSVLRGTAYWPAPMPTVITSKSQKTRLVALNVACPAGITRSQMLGRVLSQGLTADAETLETFAFARAAARAEVPWEAFLGITNQVGPNAHGQWLAHAKSAAAAACEVAYARITAPNRRPRPPE